MIKITVKDIGFSTDAPLELTTKGCFAETQNGYTLEYDEIFGDGLTGHTVVTVSGEHTACVVRTGSIISEITVQEGKRHVCLYRTPFGTLSLGIYGKYVRSRLHEKGGTLKLSYTVDNGGALTAEKQMTIQMNTITQ